MTTKDTRGTASKRNQATRRRAMFEGTIFRITKGKEVYWVTEISIGDDAKTGKRIRRRRYSKTKSEAKKKLEAMKLKYAGVTQVDAEHITVGEWMEKWFQVYSAPKLRENTQNSYRQVIAIIERTLGPIKLDQLTAYDIQRVLFTDLKRKYRTAKYVRLLLTAAMRRAVVNGMLSKSPCIDIELPPKPEKKPFVKPTQEDWQNLINAETPFYCWRMILLTEYVTGCRISELLALRWEDFELVHGSDGSLTGGVLHIRHALIRGSAREDGAKRNGQTLHELLLAPTKTAESRRDLPVPVEYCRELTAYRKNQLTLRLARGEWPHPESIFTTETGDYLSPSTFSSRFSAVKKRYGIRSTFHMLRHDMASRMKASGMFDMKDIQEQLGHSTIQITMDIYTHLEEDEKNAVRSWVAGGLKDVL